MKIETAIERLRELIDCNEKYEAFLTEEDDNDEELRDTELTLETLRMAVQALEEKPRWIPCSERLPEMHEEEFCDETYRTSDMVLFCTADRVHVGCCFRYYNDELFWEIEDGQRCANVTAWMPMPEAYGGE